MMFFLMLFYVFLLLIVLIGILSVLMGVAYALWVALSLIFRNRGIYALSLVAIATGLYVIDPTLVGILLVFLSVSLLSLGIVYTLIYWITLFPRHFRQWWACSAWIRIISLTVPIDLTTGLLLHLTRG
jgi:hypothetical protein